MTRSLTGYAVFAILGILVLKVLVGILGLAMSVIGTLIGFAVVVLILYVILRVVSPTAAQRIREGIADEPRSEV